MVFCGFTCKRHDEKKEIDKHEKKKQNIIEKEYMIQKINNIYIYIYIRKTKITDNYISLQPSRTEK